MTTTDNKPDPAPTAAKPAEPKAAPKPGKADEGAFRVRLKVRMLQIAERLLEDEGLSGVQARRIAKEADCAVGTLYNVFNGLDGLIVSANTQTLRAFGRAGEAAMRRAASRPFGEQLEALALAYLDFAIAHRRRWKAVFDHQMPEGEDVPAPYRFDQNRLFAMIELPLASIIADPAERSSAARSLFAAVHGIVALALDRKLGPFDAAETERQVRFFVGLMAKGLADRPATIS
jgi:AcrR family transcriptional regulator